MQKRSFVLSILYGVCCVIMAQSLTMSNGLFWCRYSCELQVPTMVKWCVTRASLGNAQREPAWKFRADVPFPYGRATHATYTNTGYDRGHMAPAADFAASRSMMRQTFVMSNVCPQAPALNRGPWKMTEVRERSLARVNDSCHVLALPLFLKADTTWIGSKLVAVPDAFVKIIYNINPDTLYNVYFLWNK